MKKNLKKIIIICLLIILIELISMGIMYILRERNISHIDSLNDIVKTNDGYVAVGISDFNNSKFISKKTYEYTNTETKEKQRIIASQAKIAKYDNNYNLIWENTFNAEYDSTFYNILKLDDGYIVVGSYVKDETQINAHTRDALIAKYDNDGKMLWYKTYSVLSNTEFYKVVLDNDNLIVIGRSIYENFEVGTHTIGGGIIVKYSLSGEELAHNNYGGNKSGRFSDIIVLDDGYLICGKDATNYGIILKMKKDFQREENDTNLITKKIIWQRTFANTDNEGFTSMALIDNNIYLIGAINVSDEKDKDGNPLFQYDAGIVTYNINGKYLGKTSLNEKIHNRFNSLSYDDNYLYLSTLINTDAYYDGENQKTSIIKYDYKNQKYETIYNYQGNNNYIINKIYKDDDNYLCIGTEDNSCGILGCDYQILLNKCIEKTTE